MSFSNGTDPASATPSLTDAFKTMIKDAVAEALKSVQPSEPRELLEPEELARKLKVPVSWVYEQSRQGNIPTHRMGRYIRFDLQEVIESQKKHGRPS